MDFLNDAVVPENLPAVEAVPLIPLTTDYRKVLRLEWAITVLFLLAVLVVLTVLVQRLQQPIWISIAGGAWLILASGWLFLLEKSFQIKAYAIRDKDVIYHSGWIFRTTHTCPFNRIQHSTVTMGPLERKFGLARLVLYTAGSNDADLSIPGLTQATAQQLKEWITKKIANEPEGQL